MVAVACLPTLASPAAGMAVALPMSMPEPRTVATARAGTVILRMNKPPYYYRRIAAPNVYLASQRQWVPAVPAADAHRHAHAAARQGSIELTATGPKTGPPYSLSPWRALRDFRSAGMHCRRWPARAAPTGCRPAFAE